MLQVGIPYVLASYGFLGYADRLAWPVVFAVIATSSLLPLYREYHRARRRWFLAIDPHLLEFVAPGFLKRRHLILRTDTITRVIVEARFAEDVEDAMEDRVMMEFSVALATRDDGLQRLEYDFWQLSDAIHTGGLIRDALVSARGHAAAVQYDVIVPPKMRPSRKGAHYQALLKQGWPG